MDLTNKLRSLNNPDYLDQRQVAGLKKEVNSKLQDGSLNEYGKMVLQNLAQQKGIK